MYLILVVIIVVHGESALVSHISLVVIIVVEEALTVTGVAVHVKRLILVASGMLWPGSVAPEKFETEPLVMRIKVRLVEVGREVTEAMIVDVWIVHGLRLKDLLCMRRLNLIVAVRQIFAMAMVTSALSLMLRLYRLVYEFRCLM